MTHPTTVTDAAYHVVHDYPGGAVSLAPRIGIKSPRVLSNKVNPNCTTHHLTLTEAVAITDLASDLRLLDAWEAQVGRVGVAILADDCVSDTALLETYTRLLKELGEFSATFHDALADGSLSSAEIDRMEAEMFDCMRAGLELVSRARALVDD